MTARSLLTLLLRRWYMVVTGAILTIVTMYLGLQQPGVYWTKLTVVLLAPAEEYYPNKMQDPHYSMAPMAGLVVAKWNDGRPNLMTASGETTIFGEGQREAVIVRMPNQGSQWRPLYLSPNIDVQVVGGDAAEVEQRALEVTGELAELLAEEQEHIGVARRMRITSVSSPNTPTVHYVSGSRIRTLAATALLGAWITFAAVYWFERIRTSGPSRRPRNNRDGTRPMTPPKRTPVFRR